MKPSALITERDRILREAGGFDDIEDEWGHIEPLVKVNGVVDPRQAAAGDYDALATYFRLAGHFLHDHAFTDEVERRIWELHQDGASYTRITRTVRREMEARELPRQRVYRKRVHRVVVRLRGVMLGKQLEPRRPRGRPRDRNGCYRGCRTLRARLPDAVSAALDRIASRTGRNPSSVVQWLIAEVDRRMAAGGAP